MLCLPSVDALRELRPKGVCPNVVSLKCRCSKKRGSRLAGRGRGCGLGSRVNINHQI